uniref:Uncharacterized protein n=1 Tax=Parascaris equorum TaxID=6256 RepID=A0A914R8I5_PAREQ
MEQCTIKSNVWSQHAQRSFRTICAICANEITRSSCPNVVNILLKLFAEAILSGAVDSEFKNSVVHEMLHFGESGGSITSNSFCLNVAAEGALFGQQNADIGDEKHSYIRKKTLAQMAYVMLIGGKGCGNPRKSLEEFRKYMNDVFGKYFMFFMTH